MSSLRNVIHLLTVFTAMLMLIACAADPIKTRSITFEKSPEIMLPAKARLSVYLPPEELNRRIYHLEEGIIIQSAALTVFDRVFQEALPSRAAKEPHLIATVTSHTDMGSGERVKSADARISLYFGNGQFVGDYNASAPARSRVDNDPIALRNAYILAFQDIANQMLANEKLASLFRKGFGDDLTPGARPTSKK
jgi:hypothetical protein